LIGESSIMEFAPKTTDREDRMKTASTTILCFALATAATAQTIDVSMRVDTERNRRPISPLIYGVNNSSSVDANLASRRQGGDRYTTYNWENNASNSGHWTDDPRYVHLNHISDANLTGYVASNIPAKAITDFHDASLGAGTYSLVTLQAGHVARDLNGPVSPAEAVPNLARWCQVKFDKGAELDARPDPADDFVYMDELLNYLITKYGPTSGERGIKGYGISNEPGAWTGVHPRAHPTKEGYADILAITTGLATTVKRMDPTAEVYGGVTYGFSEMKDFDGAPDQGAFPQYTWYIDALLAGTKAASDAAGMRLMDVLDVHWYSEAEGNTPYEPVAWSPSTPDIIAARLQAPRSLWDRSYVEKSWITGAPGRYSHTGELFGEPSIALIPRLKESIARYNDGTKLAFGEFGYGGYDHVSGGLAIADALGIFGRDGVYLACHWDEIADYVASAYRLYRNYDGMRSTFGDIALDAATDDHASSSIYASTTADGRELHLIVINKSMERSLRSSIAITSASSWRAAGAYGFDATSTEVRAFDDAIVEGSTLTYELAPLSAVHIVLERTAASSASDELPSFSAVIAPNPCTTNTSLILDLERPGRVTVDLFDALGRRVRSLGDGDLDVGRSTIAVETSDLAAGRYVARVVTAERTLSLPLTVVH
jgi:mannan endo-1,4-beta-mannosidase